MGKKELSILLPSALIGVVTGMLFINFVSDGFFKIFIGTAALFFSLYHLVKNEHASNRFAGGLGMQGVDSGKLAVLFGFLGGTASTLVHAGGMVMSIYLANRHKDQRGFVATLVLFFGIINLSKWIAYTHAGVLTWDASIVIWAISPVIILGGFIGDIINRKLQYSLFRTIILILILVFGLRLLMTA